MTRPALGPLGGGVSAAPSPRAGEVYLQLGIRLVITHAANDHVTYCCRAGAYTGPVRCCPLSVFLEQIVNGTITRAEES